MADRLVDTDFDPSLLFNQKTTASLIGISTQAFSKWGVSPDERRGREAFYFWPKVYELAIKRKLAPLESENESLRDELKVASTSKAESNDEIDPKYEAAREHRARADKIEIENALARGSLVTTQHMAEAMSKGLQAIRARLRAAGSKVAPLANPGNPKLAREHIDREHNECLADLADFDSGPDPGGSSELGELASDGAGDVQPAEAPAKPNGKRVVRRRKKVKQRK
jgi:phage terminase Nu1 subunit (DNA packaging protein)